MSRRYHLVISALIGLSVTFLSTTFALAMLGGGPEGEGGVPPPGCDSPIPPKPVITSISPTSGPIGTSVVVSGQNLLGTMVLVNGVPDLSFAPGGSNTNTTKTVIIPPGATTGHITAVVPPPPTSNCPYVSSTPTDADIFTVRLFVPSCCLLLPNSALKGRFGRLVVAFPATAVPKGTRVAVLKNGKEVQAGHGSQSWELLSGTYEVTISGKTVPNVIVKPGHDTQVKVGVLRISAGKNTRAAVLDGSKEIASGHGDQLIGLPVGAFHVRVAGQAEGIEIQDGKVTEF